MLLPLGLVVEPFQMFPQLYSKGYSFLLSRYGFRCLVIIYSNAKQPQKTMRVIECDEIMAIAHLTHPQDLIPGIEIIVSLLVELSPSTLLSALRIFNCVREGERKMASPKSAL